MGHLKKNKQRKATTWNTYCCVSSVRRRRLLQQCVTTASCKCTHSPYSALCDFSYMWKWIWCPRAQIVLRAPPLNLGKGRKSCWCSIRAWVFATKGVAAYFYASSNIPRAECATDRICIWLHHTNNNLFMNSEFWPQTALTQFPRSNIKFLLSV